MTLQTEMLLGDVLSRQGDYGRAIELQHRAHSACSHGFGSDHEATLYAAGDLANTHRNAGCFPEAEALYRTLLKQERQRHGLDHFETMQVSYNLALALKKQHKCNEALELLRDTLPRATRLLGPDHSTTQPIQHLMAELAALG